MVLAGIGLAQIVSTADKWLRDATGSGSIAPLACAVLAVWAWCSLSFGVWTGPTLTVLRYRVHDNLLAASYVAHGPAPCGIGLYGSDGHDWLDSGGYTYFHRPAPIYWPKDSRALTSAASAFDTLISVGSTPAGLGFTALRCFGPVCVARRSGDCRPMPQTPMPFPASLVGLANNGPTTSKTNPGLAAAAR
jgi:hypothetical protein